MPASGSVQQPRSLAEKKSALRPLQPPVPWPLARRLSHRPPKAGAAQRTSRQRPPARPAPPRPAALPAPPSAGCRAGPRAPPCSPPTRRCPGSPSRCPQSWPRSCDARAHVGGRGGGRAAAQVRRVEFAGVSAAAALVGPGLGRPGLEEAVAARGGARCRSADVHGQRSMHSSRNTVAATQSSPAGPTRTAQVHHSTPKGQWVQYRAVPAVAHDARNLNHVIQAQVAVVLDVLLLRRDGAGRYSQQRQGAVTDRRVTSGPAGLCYTALQRRWRAGRQERWSSRANQPFGSQPATPHQTATPGFSRRPNPASCCTRCAGRSRCSTPLCRPTTARRRTDTDLLAVPGRLLERLDDERRCRGDHGHLGAEESDTQDSFQQSRAGGGAQTRPARWAL